MKLELLKDVTSVNDYKIIHMDSLKLEFPEHFNKDSGQMDYKWFESEIRPFNFIYIRSDVNSLSITMEDKERGIKGCSVVDLIELAKRLVEEHNKVSRSRENSMIVTKLDEAIMWYEKTIKGV